MSQADTTALITLEYEALKEEQRDRIKTRDGLIYATLASVAAVTAGSVKASPLILLVLPAAVTVLGWTYLANDRKISELGGYVRDVLAVRLDALVPGVDAFGWERHHRRQCKGRTARKAGQLAADLAIFCGSAAAAVALVWAHQPPAWAWVLSLAELAVTAVLAHQITTSSR